MAVVPSIDVGSMIVAVRESVNCMEVWSNARTNLPLVRSRIESLQSEIETYYSTLRKSAEIADCGVDFAKNAQDLCECLMDPAVPSERIRALIEQMRAIAKLAQWDVSKTTRSFRDSRHKINEIGETITRDRDALVQQQESERRRYNKADEDRDDITGGAIIAGAVASFIFPFAIPLIAGVAMGARKEKKKIMKDSSREISRLSTVHTELGAIESGIERMIGHIDEQATWWVEVETMLTTISGNVSGLRATQSNRIRLAGMRSEWSTIQSRYQEYKEEVARVGW